MGNFYVNFTLQGPTQANVAAALAGRTAIVTPAVNNSVVVYDEESESQMGTAFGAQLSSDLGCPVLAIINHDDDLLIYELFEEGEKSDEYCSNPGLFSGGDQSPSGGNSERLCGAFGARDTNAVTAVLRPTADTAHTFAVEQHAALVKALGLSDHGVGLGYNYAVRGELPDGLDDADVIKIGS